MKRFLKRQVLNPAFKRFQLLPQLRCGSQVGAISYDLCRPTAAPRSAPLVTAVLGEPLKAPGADASIALSD